MQEGYFINLTDDEGNSFNLEVVGEVEYEGGTYVVFLPADMDEDNPDYGFIILKSVEESGEPILCVIEDEEEMQAVYDLMMDTLYEETEE